MDLKKHKTFFTVTYSSISTTFIPHFKIEIKNKFWSTSNQSIPKLSYGDSLLKNERRLE